MYEQINHTQTIRIMESIIHLEEEHDKRKGLIVSVVVHIMLLFLCFFPYAVQQSEQPISGILVALGTPDGGNSDAVSSSTQESEEEENEVSENESNDDKSEKETAPSPQPQEKSAKKVVETQPVKEKVLTHESEKPVINTTAQEAAKKERKKAEADAKESQRIAAEKAKAEAQKKAAEEAAKKAKYNQSKKQFSDLFGSGRGTNNSKGNQGDPKGDPNADNLKGLAKGSGRIGGGLSDRGVVKEPQINDNSQKTGKVVIKICVDSSGKVTEARYTQRGSTTPDKHLRSIAEEAAYKYVFTPSDVELQCGSITIDFKLGK